CEECCIIENTCNTTGTSRLISRPGKRSIFPQRWIRLILNILLKSSGYHSFLMCNVLVISQSLLYQESANTRCIKIWLINRICLFDPTAFLFLICWLVFPRTNQNADGSYLNESNPGSNYGVFPTQPVFPGHCTRPLLLCHILESGHQSNNVLRN